MSKNIVKVLLYLSYLVKFWLYCIRISRTQKLLISLLKRAYKSADVYHYFVFLEKKRHHKLLQITYLIKNSLCALQVSQKRNTKNKVKKTKKQQRVSVLNPT